LVGMMSEKIKSRREIVRLVKSLKDKGKTIVFTNGCFDILHKGHIFYLKKAKDYGDVLVVGLNTDSSIRKIKGDSRPINNQRDRAYVLAAVEYVDFITFFSQTTPLNLIKEIKPDVLVKGGDWKAEEIVGGSFVRRYGGKVISLPYIGNYSTSKLICRIKRIEKAKG